MFDTYIKKYLELAEAEKAATEAQERVKHLENTTRLLAKQAVTAYNSFAPVKLEYHKYYYFQLEGVIYQFSHSECYYSLTPINVVDVNPKKRTYE